MKMVVEHRPVQKFIQLWFLPNWNFKESPYNWHNDAYNTDLFGGFLFVLGNTNTVGSTVNLVRG